MTGKATRQTKRAATAKCKPLKRKAAKTPLANAKGLIIKMSEHLPGDILLFHSNVQKALAKQISKATGSPYFDGTMHMKSFGHKHVSKKLQPLTGAFKGTEHLGSQMGHGPKGVGAICDPADFSEVVEVAPGILGPRDGSVVVDLVEPNCEPLDCLNVVQKEVFRDTVPWIVIRVCAHNGAPQPGDPPRSLSHWLWTLAFGHRGTAHGCAATREAAMAAFAKS